MRVNCQWGTRHHTYVICRALRHQIAVLVVVGHDRVDGRLLIQRGEVGRVLADVHLASHLVVIVRILVEHRDVDEPTGGAVSANGNGDQLLHQLNVWM